MAFVDWSNVYLGAKNYYSTRVDPPRLRTLLSQSRNLTHVHFFTATDEANPGQSRFHEWLARSAFLVHTQPLETRVRHVHCPKCGSEFDSVCPTCRTIVELPPHKSKMTDIDLAKHLIILADDYEEAVLVTGDKDFLPVIDWLRAVRNRKIWIFTWKQSFSGMLIGHVDGITYLDDHLAAIREP
ncbi:MAG: NYN domain-containing protein [Euryarchaeota archaeon]|nr:NYN domain-containing protein [Euryarchaeota archaeon]